MKSNTKLLRNLLYTMLVAVFFVGCKEVPRSNGSVDATRIDDYEVSYSGVQILTIDGCEYVWCKNGHGAGLTHKGNCRFCLARHAK
jgi:hypothetical protein